jgi:hypothetical protein
MTIKDQSDWWTNQVIVELIRDDKDGNPQVLRRVESKNTAVIGGKKNAMRLLAGQTTKAYDQIRVGASGAAMVSNQTNVLEPVAGTLTTVDSMTIDTGRTYQWVHSYPSGGGSISCADIQEMCILNESTSPGGSAWNRSTFTPVTKTVNDKLKITYKARIT